MFVGGQILINIKYYQINKCHIAVSTGDHYQWVTSICDNFIRSNAPRTDGLPQEIPRSSIPPAPSVTNQTNAGNIFNRKFPFY